MTIPGAGSADVTAFAETARRLPDVVAAVPGYSSVLVITELPVSAQIERRVWEIQASASTGESASRLVRIPVAISAEDAPDLPLLLDAAGLRRDAFAARLGELELTARFAGFRPGFAYLDGIPDAWKMPRRATSRPRVRAGSFAIAGDMAAFYPSVSAGGWNIIGRTNAQLWNAAVDPPALIRPGDRVSLEVVEALPELPARAAPVKGDEGERIADVLHPGQRTVIVSQPAWSRYGAGLPSGGAFDRDAAAAANLAVGNREDACVLECAIVGPRLLFEREATLSWFGAAASIRVNGEVVRDPRQMHVRRGGLMEVGRLAGMRGYLAVAGGVADHGLPYAAEPSLLQDVLRSRRLPITERPRIGALLRDDAHTVRAVAGPHEAPREILDSLISTEWIVSASSDRTGVRLSSETAIHGGRDDEDSTGMLPGTVQLHPNGELVVMGPDHPITGGYTQVMCVIESDYWKIAQASPGSTLRWQLTSP